MKRIVALVATLTLLSACGHAKGAATPPPTSAVAVSNDPTTVPTSTTTTMVPVDPSVPPAVIDLPYLTAVMAKLNLLHLEQVAVIERDHRVSPDAFSLLRAEFAEPALDDQLTDSAVAANKPHINVKPQESRGPIITTPTQLVTVIPQCISFIATEDFSRLAETPVPVGQDLVSIRPINREQDAEHLNPTPWQVSYTVIPKDPDHPTPAEDQCAS